MSYPFNIIINQVQHVIKYNFKRQKPLRIVGFIISFFG